MARTTEPTSFLDDIADGLQGVELRTVVRMERDPVEAIETVVSEGEPGSTLVVMSSASEVSEAAQGCADELRGMGFEVDCEVRRGAQTHRVIVDEAAELGASYVAVTSRANTGARRAALGSVAAGVLRASPVPVLITRAASD